MSKRKEMTVAPEPLEEYVKPFDDLFEKWNQREGFRRYLEGLLLRSVWGRGSSLILLPIIITLSLLPPYLSQFICTINLFL